MPSLFCQGSLKEPVCPLSAGWQCGTLQNPKLPPWGGYGWSSEEGEELQAASTARTIMNRATCSVGASFCATGFSFKCLQNTILNSPYCKIKTLLCKETRSKQLLFPCTLYLFCVLDIATFRNFPSPEQDLPPVAASVSFGFTTLLIWMSCYLLPDPLFSKHFSLYKAFFQLFIFWRFMHNYVPGIFVNPQMVLRLHWLMHQPLYMLRT